MKRNYLGENGEVCEPLVRLVVGQIKVRLWLDFIGCGGAFNNFELPETIFEKIRAEAVRESIVEFFRC
jgi:hypothetical protein